MGKKVALDKTTTAPTKRKQPSGFCTARAAAALNMGPVPHTRSNPRGAHINILSRHHKASSLSGALVISRRFVPLSPLKKV